MTTRWREDFNADSRFRARVRRRIADQYRKGEAKGREKYGPDFMGDPLQHAFEEACDLALYLAVEIERRELEE